MKLGVCGDISRWECIKNNGFDYAEAKFSSLASISDDEFEKWLSFADKLGISVEAYNGFFSGSFCIYGEKNEDKTVSPDFQGKLVEIKEYAEKAFSRAQKLGGKIAVLGSSGARNLPKNLSKEEAESHFVNVLRVCGDAAQKYQMKIALEPLRYAETNFINTVEEGLEICKKADHPAVGLLVDFFHFYANGEDISSVIRAKDHIVHTHMARPNPDRKYTTVEDKEACKVWAKTLYDIGYNERISLECSFLDEFERNLPLTEPVMRMFREEKYID